jgi:hypothetical protein
VAAVVRAAVPASCYHCVTYCRVAFVAEAFHLGAVFPCACAGQVAHQVAIDGHGHGLVVVGVVVVVQQDGLGLVPSAPCGTSAADILEGVLISSFPYYIETVLAAGSLEADKGEVVVCGFPSCLGCGAAGVFCEVLVA